MTPCRWRVEWTKLPHPQPATGNLGARAHTVAPKAAFRVLHLAYRVFPDSAAARGEQPPTPTVEQAIMARMLKGVHS